MASFASVLTQSAVHTDSGGRLHGRGLARSALVVSQEHDGLLGSGGPIVHRGMIQTPTPERHRAERANRTGRSGEQYHSARGGKVQFFPSMALTHDLRNSFPVID